MSTEALFQQLKHPNPYLREQAMWDLAEQRDETTIPRLMTLLDESDTTYRRAAVKALGLMGQDAVPPLIDASLNNHDVTVRGSAVKALAQVAINFPDEPFPKEGLACLKQALRDDNPVVHIAAVMALGEVQDAAAFDILVEAFQTTDNVALAVAITNSFGSINDSRGEKILQGIINDASVDDYVRESAISALSRLELVRNNQPPA